MLLKNDFKLAQIAIESVSDDLINEWNNHIYNEKIDETNVPELMASLYNWAIKGTSFCEDSDCISDKNTKV